MRCTDERTGKELWRVSAKNTVTYEGIDLLARMLAWADAKVNMAYLEFAPVDSPEASSSSAVAASPDEGRDYYKAIDADDGRTTDYLRVAIVVPPYLETTDAALFVGNRVVFNVFSAGDRGVNGRTFDNGSAVFGLALVHAPSADVADRDQDIVFARTYSFTPKQKIDGSQISLRWTHTVGSAEEVAP